LLGEEKLGKRNSQILSRLDKRLVVRKRRRARLHKKVYGKNDVKMELAKPAWTAEEGGDYERDEAEMAKAAQHPTKQVTCRYSTLLVKLTHSRASNKKDISRENGSKWIVYET